MRHRIRQELALRAVHLGNRCQYSTYQQLSLDAPSVDGSYDTGSAPSAYPDSSLEWKLQRLKQIHDSGLITDDEFVAKKKVLLDRF